MVFFFTKLIISNFFLSYIKDVQGIDNLIKPPFIVASNHASYFDDFIVPSLFLKRYDTKLHIYVNSRFYDNFFIKKFLDHYECLPVAVRKDVKDPVLRKKLNDKAYKKALSGLNEGRYVVIFPEGGRSKDGKLKKAKNGAVRLAIHARVPIVPVGLIGTYDIMPKGAFFPRFIKARVKIGKPLTYDKYYNLTKKTHEEQRKVYDVLTREMMIKISKLTGQEYIY
jgi:1-acyl-sn-glycerol-3-phosphate acyltransferase